MVTIKGPHHNSYRTEEFCSHKNLLTGFYEVEREDGEINQEGNKYHSRFTQTDISTGRLYPWYSSLIEAEATPRASVRPEKD